MSFCDFQRNPATTYASTHAHTLMHTCAHTHTEAVHSASFCSSYKTWPLAFLPFLLFFSESFHSPLLSLLHLLHLACKVQWHSSVNASSSMHSRGPGHPKAGTWSLHTGPSVPFLMTPARDYICFYFKTWPLLYGTCWFPQSMELRYPFLRT